MSTSFAVSIYWKDYDIFARQKLSTFRSSRPAVLELAAKYKELISQLESDAVSLKSPEEVKEAEKILFIEMCEICLWGNATDLSLLTSLSYEDIQKLQGAEARKTSEKNILANDLPAAYDILKKAQEDQDKHERRIDIVLDNAGFELFVDLILAGYLLSAGIATQIVLHPKSIPWFVSDVLPTDFAALLNALSDPQLYYTTPSDEDRSTGKEPKALSEKEVSELSFLFQHWSGFHQEGKLLIRPNLFWTSAASYWRIPGAETDLYNDLKESELVIFKGDLNYRKLTGDVSFRSLLHSIETLIMKRRRGLLQLHSVLLLAHWAPGLVFARLLCEPVKQTWWSDSLKVKISDLKLLMAEEEKLVPGNGHGAVSGQLCSFATGKYRLDRSVRK